MRRRRSRSRMRHGRRIQRAKPVGGRLKFRGWKTRLTKRKEIKWVTYVGLGNAANLPIARFAVAPAGTVIWSNIGSDTVPTPYFPGVQTGAGVGQCEGQKYNLLYAEIRFTLYQFGIPTLVNGNFTETLRMIVTVERTNNTPYNGQYLYYDATTPNATINTKYWNLQTDKIWNVYTGLNNLGAAVLGGPQPKERNYRFIIPIRKTMDVVAAGQTQFPYSMRIAIYSYYTDQLFAVKNRQVTYFFKDI